VEKLAQGLQSGPGNEMAGIEGRAQLLIRLGRALENKEFFGEDGRPGNMLGKASRTLFTDHRADDRFQTTFFPTHRRKLRV
jgi:hypothetical protein